MLTLDILGIYLLILSLLALIGALFYYQKTKNEEISDMVVDIFKDPENISVLGYEIGKSFYHSMSMSSRANKSAHIKNVKNLRAIFFNSVIPKDLVEMLPENAQKLLERDPALISEVLRIISKLKSDGLSAAATEALSMISESSGGLSGLAQQLVQQTTTKKE